MTTEGGGGFRGLQSVVDIRTTLVIFTTCGLPNSFTLCPFFLFNVLKTLGLLHSHQPE